MALFVATNLGLHIVVIKLLKKFRDIDPNERVKENFPTALSNAAKNGHTEIAKSSKY